ncbi:MAG: ArnT family glycosyltransferase [Anaerolineae bacterium]
MMPARLLRPLAQLTPLAIADLLLLAPPGSTWRVVGALSLVGLLPGLAWSLWLLPGRSPLAHLLLGAGLSYALSGFLSLWLHYLPGPIPAAYLLLALNGAAILALALQVAQNPSAASEDSGEVSKSSISNPQSLIPNPQSLISNIQYPREASNLPKHWPLLLILLLALALRATALGYSEFQGDEALAMISAAEALTGHEDALFLRGKGPGEVLLPLAVWRLDGVITEGIARAPFALAGLLAILTLYRLAERLFNRRVALAASAVFAFNGFIVGFGRIVQYQALVIWFSALALLCAWQWRQTGRSRWAALSGVFLGSGLLAHYDAILVAPAIAYVGWLAMSDTSLRAGVRNAFRSPHPRPPLRSGHPLSHASRWEPHREASHRGPGGESLSKLLIRNVAIWLLALLAVALPFYLPYTLDPQAGRTGEYIGQRLGQGLLKNNLADFLHFTTFYSSFYYLLLTGLLVVGFLAWTLHRWPGGRYWAPALSVAVLAGLALRPGALSLEGTDWAAVPVGLIFLAAVLSPALSAPHRAALIWLAAPFLGYTFAVGKPLTHFYTIAPGWALLAGLAFERLARWLGTRFSPGQANTLRVSYLSALGALLVAVQSVYLWNAFLRQDREFWQDYPAGRLAFFWTPYSEPPPAGFFGFVHRGGWKAAGQKIADGTLSGDYGSNEEPEVTTWYTRGAPRACDPQPEFYLLADDVVDAIEVPADIIQTEYGEIGRVRQDNGKALSLRQRRPTSLDLGQLDQDALARAFDRSARPEAFARSARGATPASANFGGLVQLVGYDLNLDRTHPGGRLPLTLYWQVLRPIKRSYQVFTHLESDRLYAQADGVPVCWTYPTDVWRPGQIIADQHAISLPEDLPPGEYPLTVGLYLPTDDFPRLDLLDEAGNPAGTSLTLTTVEIKP